MEENLLCLRVSTCRYPTAASLHRTPILRWTVTASLNHFDGFCTFPANYLRAGEWLHSYALLFPRMTLWYQWTAMDSSSMTVSTENLRLLLKSALGCFFLKWVMRITAAAFCWSARCSPHGRDDEPRRLVAKRPRVVPEGAWSEHGALGGVRRRWGGVCADSGRLPHFQSQVQTGDFNHCVSTVRHFESFIHLKNCCS